MLMALAIRQLSFSQNVGIGTLTPNTSAQLDITSTTKGLLTPRMISGERTAIASPATGLIVYQTDGTAGLYMNTGTPAAPVWVYMFTSGSGAVTGSGIATRVAFWNGASSLSSNSNLYWDNTNGRLGVGNTSPSAKVHLGGGTRFTVSDVGSVFMQSGNAIGSARDWKIYVPMPEGNLSFRDMGFDNLNNGMAADAMMIEFGTGNVGIGTNTPSQKLHVIGNILASGTITPSDARFKKNIQLIQNPMNKLIQLNGVTYTYRAKEFPGYGFDDKEQIGVIAQDVEKVFPQLVFTDDKGFKAVDYPKLIPVLIESLKKQQEIIEMQKESINLLSVNDIEQQKQIDELKKLVEKLSKQ